MKYLKILFLFCFVFILTNLSAQVTTINACNGDTTYLYLNNYHGQVQWQSSADSLIWNNLSTSSDTLSITDTTALVYRAVIKDGTCDSVLSDTTFVMYHPTPTTANAGPDQININDISVVLDASPVIIGTGTWQIISGAGGQIASVNDPHSNFTGVGAHSYTLVWSVSNACKTTTDTLLVSFDMFHVNCGGIMYVHPTDNHGGSIWGCQGTPTNATSASNGEQNTNIIIATCIDPTIAARVCSDLTAFGYSDWYLPSADELDCIYQNRGTIGGFPTVSGIVYWSSTETNANWANGQNFTTGQQLTIYQKAGAARVRCVRKD